MATLLHSESRRLYSWWWDSHNTPKNSKWLQDNLTDMDGKVKCMIKLIEEDADSFARRAEMYYKKRPELMKLVEEFYRAYRALAERYNHATGELRHAHRKIAEAFPDQVPFELVGDSPSKSSALFDEDDESSPKRGLKQVQEMFGDTKGSNPDESFCDELVQLASLRIKILCETDRAEKAESEVQVLSKALVKMEAEKETIFLKYQQCNEKLSKMEGELEAAQKDSTWLNEKAGRAENEVIALKEAVFQLEAEKNEGLVKHDEYLSKISDLEAMASRFQEGMIEAENQAQTLKDEKDTMLHRYKQCLEKVSDLKNTISVMEEEARRYKKEAELAETEVEELKRALADLKKEKEASSLQYKCCLGTISGLEKDLSIAKDVIRRLNDELLMGNAKLRTADEKRNLLETANQSLRDEANNLVKKIAVKDQELYQKEEELEKLQTRLKDEHLRHAKVEETLKTLKDLHSRSQDEQNALADELKTTIRMVKEIEVSKTGLEEELEQVRDENQSLSQMQNEVISLREIKERLKKEVSNHTGISISLQDEISCLKDEINGFKNLQDENTRLRRKCEQGSNEKESLLKELERMEEALKKKAVEADLKGEIERENAVLVIEKGALLSQIKAITDNMHNLLEKNAVLDDSLSNAKVELEGLREKSKGLEMICELLKKEKSYLLSERDTLFLKLENVERKLEILERRFNDMEKENESMHSQVEKLNFSLGVEKQERTTSELKSETRLAGLEKQIHLLQEENKKESEKELENALKAQFEMSILQKFIKDMEEKNCSLIIECQKHVEASKLAEKVISELESESLEQQVEAEFLLDEIEKLRLGIYQIFRALDSDRTMEKVENETTFIHHIVGSIEGMKSSISKNEDEKQKLLVENSVLMALLEQMESKGIEVENEKDELLAINEQLRSDVNECDQDAAILEDELSKLCVKQADMQKAYNALQEAYSRVNSENTDLLNKFSDLEQRNDAILLDFLASEAESAILRSSGKEKLIDLKLLLEANSNLENEMMVLREKLGIQKAENTVLKEAIQSLEKKMRDDHIQIMNLTQTEAKLFDAEIKLDAAEKMNTTLNKTVTELKMEIHKSMQTRQSLENDVLHLSEKNSIHQKEINELHRVNGDLESELGLLREEVEENIAREHSLEAEASTFCFDLQVSNVHEVLLKNKVEELTGMCENLENERAVKTSEIEEMKGKVSSMEKEVTGLKSQIYAYDSVVESITEDITRLERSAVLQKKLKTLRSQEFELPVDPTRGTSRDDQSLPILQNLQMRVKTIRNLIEETNKKPVSQRRTRKGEPQMVKTKDIPLDHVSSGSLRRRGEDGPDDHILELWETAEDDQTSKTSRRDIIYEYVKGKFEPPSTDSDVEKELGVDKLELSNPKEVNDRMIIEKLVNDAQKLGILHSTTQILRRKLETNKKGKKAKNVDLETTNKQLSEAEDTIVHLVDMNGQLVKNIEDCPSDEMASPRLKETIKTWRLKVMEEAEKGSKRIERLQIELQQIQYVMLEIEDEKKSKGRNKFLRSKTIILRDFVHNGRKNSGRRKKGPRCGCFRQSTSRNAKIDS